jgi:hypothetical protein
MNKQYFHPTQEGGKNKKSISKFKNTISQKELKKKPSQI